MTPQDIATDVSTGLKPGSINTQTTYTYTYGGFGGPRIDDANQFG